MIIKNIFQISIVASIALLIGVSGTFMMMSDYGQQLEMQTIESIQESAQITKAVPTGDLRASKLYAQISPEEAAEQADYALIGMITKLQPIGVTIDEIQYVHTIVSMRIIEDLFGNYPIPTIQFRIEGGTIDGITMDIEDPVEFVKGEPTLVFLTIGSSEAFPFGAENILFGGPQLIFDYDEEAETVNSRYGVSHDREGLEDIAKAYYGEK